MPLLLVLALIRLPSITPRVGVTSFHIISTSPAKSSLSLILNLRNPRSSFYYYYFRGQLKRNIIKTYGGGERKTERVAWSGSRRFPDQEWGKERKREKKGEISRKNLATELDSSFRVRREAVLTFTLIFEHYARLKTIWRYTSTKIILIIVRLLIIPQTGADGDTERNNESKTNAMQCDAMGFITATLNDE